MYDFHSPGEMDIFIPESRSVVVNTFRRVIMQDVPHFAFNPDKISIKRNTTAWHNDYLRLRLSNIPVYGLENNRMAYTRFIHEHPKVVLGGTLDESTDGIGDDILAMSVNIEHSDAQTQCRMVTTSDCNFTINGRPITNPYENREMLICVLRLGECIQLTAQSHMSVPREHPRYATVGNVWFKEESDGHRLFFETRPGISGDEVLYRARDIILKKLNVIRLRTKEQGHLKVTKKGLAGEFQIEHDKFTIPELLSYFLQDHPSIVFSGYRCDHMLGNLATIYFKCTEDIHKILDDVYKEIDQATAKFIKI